MTVLSRHQNNYNFIRFFAAIYVIVKHSYGLLGYKFPADILLDGNLAVSIFFLISGYLITGSAVSAKSIKNYFWKRFLRIYPALAVVVVLTVFVLGPLMTVLPIHHYFTNPETYKYLISSSIFKIYYTLPGVFETNHSSGVNGSLWSLIYEIIMYIFTAIFVALPILKGKKKLVLAAVVGMFIFRIIIAHRYSWYNYGTPYLLKLNIMFLFEWSFYFLIGAFVYHYKHVIKFKLVPFLFLVLSYSICLYLNYSKITPYLHYISLAYSVFYLGNIKGWLNKFGQKGDLSYGLYIYAFPIQQCFVTLFPDISVWELLISSSLITLIFSYYSWHLIEKKSLLFKDKF